MLDPGQKVSWAQPQTECHMYAGPWTKGVLGPTLDLVSRVYWTQDKRCPQTDCPGPKTRPGVTCMLDSGQMVSTDKLSWAQPQTWCHLYDGPWTKGVLGPTPDLVSRVCWTLDKRCPQKDSWAQPQTWCHVYAGPRIKGVHRQTVLGPNPDLVLRVCWTKDKRCPQPDCPWPTLRPSVMYIVGLGQCVSMVTTQYTKLHSQNRGIVLLHIVGPGK